jgi:hypothetical protein
MKYGELPKRRQPPQSLFVAEIKVVRGGPTVVFGSPGTG